MIQWIKSIPRLFCSRLERWPLILLSTLATLLSLLVIYANYLEPAIEAEKRMTQKLFYMQQEFTKKSQLKALNNLPGYGHFLNSLDQLRRPFIAADLDKEPERLFLTLLSDYPIEIVDSSSQAETGGDYIGLYNASVTFRLSGTLSQINQAIAKIAQHYPLFFVDIESIVKQPGENKNYQAVMMAQTLYYGDKIKRKKRKR